MKNLKKIIRILFLCAIFFTACAQSTAESKPVITDPSDTEIEEIVNEVLEEKKDIIKKAKLSVTGDLMVHSWQYNEAYDKSTGEYNFMHNFSEVKKYFKDSDLVIGNLETVFAGEDVGISDYPCFNTSDSFADALKDARFNLLTTANNHSMDKGQKGLLRTLEVLDDRGIDHFGTYASQEDRDSILIKDVNGIKIAFLSYTYGTNGIPVKESYNVNIMDENLMISDIKKADELADLVVVMPHMGNEYELIVKDVFKNWTNLMFDAGADIILSSHPHVLQPMEYRKLTDENGEERLGFVIYSLGNCISSQTTPPRNAGVILNIEIQQINDNDPTIEQVSFIPIWTQFRNVQNVDHFKVRSIYDLLSLSDEELKKTVRTKDIPRIKEIRRETTKTLLGYEVPIEEIKEEYIFEKTEENIK